MEQSHRWSWSLPCKTYYGGVHSDSSSTISHGSFRLTEFANALHTSSIIYTCSFTFCCAHSDSVYAGNSTLLFPVSVVSIILETTYLFAICNQYYKHYSLVFISFSAFLCTFYFKLTGIQTKIKSWKKVESKSVLNNQTIGKSKQIHFFLLNLYNSNFNFEIFYSNFFLSKKHTEKNYLMLQKTNGVVYF